MTTKILPHGFEDLSPFAARWALGTTAERARERHNSSMDEIRAFYDAVFPKSSTALEYLNKVPYDGAMNVADRNLMNLYLSLAEITTAVEWYGQPAVVDGYEPSLVRMPVELP
ncbi:MAG: hypothetical protein HQ482_04985 [Sphingomonadales bacterium]|nr:hypothetical protein [Sphingomonadales bacterium]